MTGMVAHATRLLDGPRDAGQSPKPATKAGGFGAGFQDPMEGLGLLGGETGFSPEATGLLKATTSPLFEISRPPTHGGRADAQSSTDFRLRNTLLKQVRALQSSFFQRVCVAPNAFWISHARIIA